MKSNDQTTSNLITPIILSVSPATDQAEVATNFIQEHLGWNIDLTSPQLKLINQDLETISIETIRNLISELAYAPHLGKSRAFALLSADQLSIAAQHAFLKSLEEPPANTLLLLISSAKDKLLPTIRSRCIPHLHQSAAETLNTEDIPLELKKLLTDPTDISYNQLIEVAAKYKDRDQALQVIRQLIFLLHHQQTKSKRMIKLQNKLLTTLDNLHANTNVRLTLENCFFALKSIF
jgi:DNA polymerase III delta prime subunit